MASPELATHLKLQPELAEHPEERYRVCSIGWAAIEHVKAEHEGKDMTAIEDKETDLEGEQTLDVHSIAKCANRQQGTPKPNL